MNNNHFFEPQMFSNTDFYNFGGEEYSNMSSKRKAKKDKRKEKLDNFKEKVHKKTGDGKAIHSVNKFNPAFVTMRGSVLSILNSNVVGMSSALAEMKAKSQEDWEKVMQKWYRWGGEKAKFDHAMIRGSKKKALFKDLVEKFQRNKKNGFDGEHSNADGKGADTAANSILVASSLLTVASTALALAPEPTATTKAAAAGLGSGALAFGSMGSIFKDYAKKQGAKEDELSKIPETKDIPDAPLPTDEKELEKIVDDSEGWSTKKKVIVGVSVVAALGTIFGILKWKKVI